MVLKKACALMFSIPPGPCPSRFWGFRLKRTLRSDCASGERNCGIPSLALARGEEREGGGGGEEGKGRGRRGGGEERKGREGKGEKRRGREGKGREGREEEGRDIKPSSAMKTSC